MPVTSAPRLRPGVLVFAAILLYVAAALYGASGKSSTFDEPVHVAGGYTYWSLNDYRLHPENGNLTQRILGLPVVLRGPNFLPLDDPRWRQGNLWSASEAFLYDVGNDASSLIWSARLIAVCFAALLALLVYRWSLRLFGSAGAWVSLAIFACSPTFLAHGPLATSDVITTMFFLGSTWALWTVMHEMTPRTTLLSMAAVGALFLSKFTSLVFVPIALLMLAARLVSGRPLVMKLGATRVVEGRSRQAPILAALTLAHVAAVILIIWASYGFRYSAFGSRSLPGDSFADPWNRIVDSTVVGRSIEFSRRHRMLPEAYLFGLATVRAYSKTRVMFLNGTTSRAGGDPGFFPYAALVKSTLPALILVAALPVLLALRRKREGLYDLLPLFILIGVYWAFAISSGMNIGHRHLLPALAATTVLLGAAGPSLAAFITTWRTTKRVVATGAVVAVLLAWHAVDAIRIAPNFLAYFNPIAGGPGEAYHHLVDSSLDWGQDLPGLRQWLEENGLAGGDSVVYLSYFGTARPAYYGVQALDLPGFLDRTPGRIPRPLVPGVYCISATMLQGVYLYFASGPWTEDAEQRYRRAGSAVAEFSAAAADPVRLRELTRRVPEGYWLQTFRAYEQLRFARLASRLRARQPDANVGHSILIYRVGRDELREAVAER